jgi:hypothetical protein
MRVIWKVALAYRELRIVDEQGLLAWAEDVAAAVPERGPPQPGRKMAA